MELTDAIYSNKTDTVQRRKDIFLALFNLGIDDVCEKFYDRLNHYRKEYGSFANLTKNYEDYMRWRDRVVALDIAKELNPIYRGFI